MSVMLSKTYAALRAAGTPETQAREAAEEIADFQQHLDDIRMDIKGLQETKWLVRVLVACLVI